MANAGNHNDTRLLKSMITEGKLIKINSYDHPVVAKIKTRFNFIVMNDEAYNRTFNGKKFVCHKAWEKVNKTLLWANQLRMKHWFFQSIR